VQNNEQTINQLQPEDQERWFDLRTGMEMSRGNLFKRSKLESILAIM